MTKEIRSPNVEGRPLAGFRFRHSAFVIFHLAAATLRLDFRVPAGYTSSHEAQDLENRQHQL